MNNTSLAILPHTRPIIAKKNIGGGKLPKKVAILYTDERKQDFYTEEQFWTVSGSRKEAMAFEPHFKKLGIKTVYIAGNASMAKKLSRAKPDMALNLVTTVKGYDYLGATVPSTLELLEIPYTGASILGFALGCNKHLIHTLLASHGINVPHFQLMASTTTPLDPTLKFPLILKLNEEHSNVEITRKSVVENETELRRQLRYLINKYEQDVLVSEFIDGREFAAFVLESYNKQIFITERNIHLPNNKSNHEFLEYEIVWGESSWYYEDYVKYQPYHDPLLTEMVKQAFDIAKMAGYGKFDIRMDRLGKYYFIDANANCHFGPPEWNSEMSVTLEKAGIPFTNLLKKLLQNTMRQWGY